MKSKFLSLHNSIKSNLIIILILIGSMVILYKSNARTADGIWILWIILILEILLLLISIGERKK